MTKQLTPQDVDAYISAELHANRKILDTTLKQLEYHQKKQEELERCIGCDHDMESAGQRARTCRHCGFTLVTT